MKSKAILLLGAIAIMLSEPLFSLKANAAVTSITQLASSHVPCEDCGDCAIDCKDPATRNIYPHSENISY